jgi:hypothetical protein
MESGFCWQCGVETYQGANFCHSCGAPLASQARPKPSAKSTPTLNRDETARRKELTLPEFIEGLLDVRVSKLLPRFKTPGWRHQGQTDIGCFDCGTAYHVFRKPYKTTKGDYEYWAIVCVRCGTCNGLDVMDEPTKMAFRKWSVSSPVDDHTRIMTHHRPEDSTSTRPNLVSKAPNSDIEEPVKQRVPRSSFSPTEEQIAIIEGAKQHTDIAVEALAGTGKTTTLKLLADSKVGLKGTYVAFNKSIVDEAKAKFPSSVHCSTAHGLAYQSIGREFASRLQSTQRLSFKQIAEWLEAGAFGFKSSISNHVLDPAQMAQHAQATVRNFCKSIDPEISTQHVKMPVIIEAHSPNAKAFAMAVLPLAKKIWTDLLLQQGFMKLNNVSLTQPGLPLLACPAFPVLRNALQSPDFSRIRAQN